MIYSLKQYKYHFYSFGIWKTKKIIMGPRALFTWYALAAPMDLHHSSSLNIFSCLQQPNSYESGCCLTLFLSGRKKKEREREISFALGWFLVRSRFCSLWNIPGKVVLANNLTIILQDWLVLFRSQLRLHSVIIFSPGIFKVNLCKKNPSPPLLILESIKCSPMISNSLQNFKLSSSFIAPYALKHLSLTSLKQVQEIIQYSLSDSLHLHKNSYPFLLQCFI